jgi:hypothetical protein
MVGWAKMISPEGPRIWALLVVGYEKTEIAVELHISLRKVQRVCAKLVRKQREEQDARQGESACVRAEAELGKTIQAVRQSRMPN